MIDLAELGDVRQFLGEASTPLLRATARYLWPAAAVGHAGVYSLLALDLIADELDDRDWETAA